MCSPIVGITAQSLDTDYDFKMCWYAYDGTQYLITNLTTVGGILPDNMIYIPTTKSILFSSLGDPQQYLTHVSSTGVVLDHHGYTNPVLTNLEYDLSTQQIFLIGYDQN